MILRLMLPVIHFRSVTQSVLLLIVAVANLRYTLVFALDFRGIPPATSLNQSKSLLNQRRNRILQWFANISLPLDIDENNNPNDNGRLDSRDDVLNLTNWVEARILLNMSTDKASDIILDPRTAPFGVVGTSYNKYKRNKICRRDGDYDFALIDWLRMVYVARMYPGRFSSEAVNVVVRKLLTVSGNKYDGTYNLDCGLLTLSDIPDTENHVLMIYVAQYLTNQLLAELPDYSGNDQVNNDKNGLHAQMLNELAIYLRQLFYEYNSRPYQGYLVSALNVLNSFAKEPRVSLAAGMILDLVSGWTAIQTNKLRRFQPFRRQEQFILPDQIVASRGSYSWAGDGEPERLAFLVGNYGYLHDNMYFMWDEPIMIQSAVSNSYRMDDVLIDLAIRQDGQPRFVASYHNAIEIYASTASALITAGGVYEKAKLLNWQATRENDDKSNLKTTLLNNLTIKEAGWAQPTTVIPTRESSTNIQDMIRFQGHTDLMQRENTCVYLGFACGIAGQLGTKVAPLAQQCADRFGDWAFFDFEKPRCPLDYGFYMAYYERQCETVQCNMASNSGTYGLLEVVENTTMSFDDFKSKVLDKNTMSFLSSGVQKYYSASGRTISFEIFPLPGKSSLVSVDGQNFDRTYANWALARGNTIQSTTPGRFTFDSAGVGNRLILDMTEPQQPRRFLTELPSLRRSSSVGGEGGLFFDDGGSVITRFPVEVVSILTSKLGLGILPTGLSMRWRSGLEVQHGTGVSSDTTRLSLQDGEYITEVYIGRSFQLLDRLGRVRYLRIRTNRGREIKVGMTLKEVTYAAKGGEQIIAFYGYADKLLNKIGVLFSKTL